MAKIVSDKTAIFLTDPAVTPPAAVNIVSATAAKPSVMAVSAGDFTTMALVNGDQVYVTGTGKTQLDGKFFSVSSVGTPANSFTLDGSDLSGAGALGAVGTVTAYNMAGLSPEFKKACESSITINGQDPDSVDLSDMCDSMTKLGDPKPPTVSFTGFVNNGDAGFHNMIRASLESPKASRIMTIVFPDGEYITGPAEVGAISVSAARGQGLSYSGTATYTQVPTYSWALA